LGPYGTPTLNGLQAAVAYLNAGHAKAKNVHYVVVSRDTASNPTEDQADARQLVQSGVRYFYGDSLNGTGFAAEQVAFNQAKAISFASVPDILADAGINKEFPYAFGAGPEDSVYENPYVKTFGPQSNGKIAVIYEDYQAVINWGTGTAAAARKAGYKVFVQEVPITSSDDTAQLRALQASGANMLVIQAVVNPYLILQDLGQIGWVPKIIVGTAPASPAEAASLNPAIVTRLVTGEAPPTLVAPTSTAKPTNPLTEAYFKYYAPLSHEVPGKFDSLVTIGTYSFDAMLIIDQAIAKAGTTNTASVVKALDSGTVFHGSRGDYKYGPNQRFGPLISTWKLVKYTPTCAFGMCEAYSGPSS
jgi:ABC-type branched-subunit amino acid transport system substrate-binding protein